MESLIKAGAFDTINQNRAYLLSIVEKVVDKASKASVFSMNGAQSALFDMQSPELNTSLDEQAGADAEDFSPDQKLKMEKDMLGLYISGHPLMQVQELLQGQIGVPISEINDLQEGGSVKIGGLLTGCRKLTTKRKETMMVANLEDLSGTIPLVIFPKSYEKYSQFLINDAIVIIKGKINRDMRTNEFNIIVDTIDQLDEGIKERVLIIDIDGVEDKNLLDQVKIILTSSPGLERVLLRIKDKVVEVGESLKVNISPELVMQLEQILGQHSAKIELRAVKKAFVPNVGF